MAWGLSLIGYAALSKSLTAMIPGATDTWHIGPNTDYDVYVEFGTSRMPARAYVKPGAERGAAVLKELVDKARNSNDLLRLLALKMEAEMKKVVQEKSIIDTGNLMRSIEAVKQ